MALNPRDLTAMMAGFEQAGFRCILRQASATNPLKLEWRTDNAVRSYRLWTFDITHGGGGPTVRAADEYRIQITNGPSAEVGLDQNGVTDLLMGYSRDRDVVVAYDRRWLEKWMEKGGGSPSVQVKEADMQTADEAGMHHLTKAAGFGEAGIVTLKPRFLPAYLADHTVLLDGAMPIDEAISTVTATPHVQTVWDYCVERGFYFDPDLLARYIAALLAKPFVICSGVSGTGKSKMVELVAEFYTRTSAGPAPGSIAAAPAGDHFAFVPATSTPDPSRFALVPVRPDWIDNQSILGFVNPITREYESTQALDLILRADKAAKSAPAGTESPRYFMLLDEMNLARVEHYFSDWLACTESRRRQPNGSITQQPVPLHRVPGVKTKLSQPDGTSVEVEVPPTLAIPTNLVVTGTVNVDETTFGFSPKVLDRAMVIEFDTVSLDDLRRLPTANAMPAYRFPEVLPPFRIAAAEEYQSLPEVTHRHLVAVNALLAEARLHFGYRSAAEIALFITIYHEFLPQADANADPDRLKALDVAILQKVLPRLQGNRAKTERPLARLVAFLRDLVIPADDADLDTFNVDADARLPASYRRSIEMLEAVRSFGFVSFFK